MVIDILSPKNRERSISTKKSSRKLSQSYSVENASSEITHRTETSPDTSFEASCEASIETPQETSEDVHEVFRKLSEVQNPTISLPSHQDDTPLESTPEAENPIPSIPLPTNPQSMNRESLISKEPVICSNCLVPVTTKFCPSCGKASVTTINSTENNMVVRSKPPAFANLLEKEIWEEEERQRKHAEERKRIEADLQRVCTRANN